MVHLTGEMRQFLVPPLSGRENDMRYTDHQQRQLDIASGRQLDILTEARRRAALADARDRDCRAAARRGMLPDIPWAELLRQEEE
jgi:hypothetical protein